MLTKNIETIEDNYEDKPIEFTPGNTVEVTGTKAFPVETHEVSFIHLALAYRQIGTGA